MKYIIVVDKQPRTNPSSEKRETTIDIEELRRKGNVHDDFVIDKGIAKVYRRIGLTKTHMTYVLDNQVIEELGELKIKLFQGYNYIYIKDEYNNHLCAEYVIKNDFTDRYVTSLQMESAIEETASNIKLYVSQSLEGYSDTEQIKAMIELKANEIKEEVSRDYATQDALEQEKSERVQTANSITQTVSSVKENVENQLKNTEERITKFEQDLDSIELSVTAVKDNVAENVVNGDFKNDLNNWEVSSSGMMGVETINNKKWLYMGIYSYDVADSISQKITTLIKDTQYRLSFDAYKQEDSDGAVNVSISFYNSSNTLIDSKVVGFTFSNTAQSYNCEFNSPSNFEYAILKFYNKGNPDKEMFIGNISIIGGALWQRVTQLQLSVDGMQSEVSKKVGNNEVISKINQSAEAVGINASKIELSALDILNLLAGNEINLGSKNITITSEKFKVDKNGDVTCANANITGGSINLGENNAGNPTMSVYNQYARSNIYANVIEILNNNGYIELTPGSVSVGQDENTQSSMDSDWWICRINDIIQFELTQNNCFIKKLKYETSSQTSLKSKKKYIKKLKVNATELIKNSDICLYNLKGEKAKSKKHIGLVIGKGYNCPTEVISEDGQGVEQYSMTSLAWKAIQELIEENNNLKQRIEKLEAK